MQISNTIALVTGANRGLGLAFSRELIRRGAAKVYGAARHLDLVTESAVTPVGLDITDQDQVAAIAARCSDVSLLVNNAGVMRARILGLRHPRHHLTPAGRNPRATGCPRDPAPAVSRGPRRRPGCPRGR